jgi:Ca2+-binding RTX toxin-like protein
MTFVVDRAHYGTGIVLGTYSEDIEVLEGAGVCSTNSVAIAMFMDDADLLVSGEVLGYATGAWIVGDDATVTVGTNGTIGANGPEYARGLEVDGGGLLLENDGFIVGYDTGVHLMGGNGTTSTLLNRANITGNLVGIFRDLGDSDSVVDRLVITNTGAIHGTDSAIAVHEGLDAREVVNNQGLIYGDVSLGSGNDLYDGRGGIVVGQIRLGGGDDQAFLGDAAETVHGGAGNDNFVLGSAGHSIIEDQGGGIDTVQAAVSHTLSAHVEKLRLTGAAALNGTGNGLANVLTGNTGANTLKGMGGNDRLTGGLGHDTVTGGLGNDVFVFAALADAGDVVTDFRNLSGNNDRFLISAAAFGGGLAGGQQLSASQFQVANDNVLQGKAEAGIRFIFEADATKLWYDSNGSAAGGLRLVADLQSGATMSAADIWLM